MNLLEIFVREVALSYRTATPLAPSVLAQSGAFATDSRLRPLLTSGSGAFEIPHINAVDAGLEPNYGNTVMTDIAVPRVLDGFKVKGRAAFLNEGFVESRLLAQLAGASPLQAIAQTLDNFWARQLDNRAIATAFGLVNYDAANGKKLTTEASTFSVDAFLDAEGSMAEAFRGNGVIVVHPAIATRMRKQNLIEKVAISSDLPPVQVYNGRRVIESATMTAIPNDDGTPKFVTYLLGAGAFAADMVASADDMELERTANTGNGHGHTVLWTRRNALVHPQGFSFVAETLTGGTKNEALSASWGDLQKADSWKLETDASNVAIRFLITE